MNNLTTRKIVLGMLMTLVLAFGMQDVADAVTVSVSTNIPDAGQGVSTIQVKPDQEFEITLTVDLQGRTRIRDTSNRYVTDTGQRVDSSGIYKVTDISVGTNMREFQTLQTTAANGDSLDDYIESRRPSGYSEERVANGDEDDTIMAGSHVSDSSGSVFDSTGNAVYYYRPPSTDPPVTAHRGNPVKVSADYWIKVAAADGRSPAVQVLSLIHISEPTRPY